MDLKELVDRVSRPDAYDHTGRRRSPSSRPTSPWCSSPGEYVYKVKKPLDLGFLDFTTIGPGGDISAGRRFG